MFRYILRHHKRSAFLGYFWLILYALNRPLLAALLLYDLNMAQGVIAFKPLPLLGLNLLFFLYYFSSSWLSEYYLDKLHILSQHTLNRGLFQALAHCRNQSWSVSEINRQFTNDIPLICETYLQGVMNVIYFVVSFVSGSLVLAYLNPWILFYLIAVTVLTLWALKRLIQLISQRQIEYNESLSTLTRKVSELLNNLSLVRIFRLENRFTREFNTLSEESTTRKFKATFIEDAIEVINQASSEGVELGLYVLGAFLIYWHQMSVSDLVAVLATTSTLTAPIYAFSRVLGKFKRTSALRERLQVQLQAGEAALALDEAEAASQPADAAHAAFTGLTLQNYQGCYGERPLHLPVTQALKAGGKYALIGPNGAGKSTLISTLLGEHTDYHGQVLFNGQPLGSGEGAWRHYWSEISYVPQTVTLLETTLRENILLGAPFDEQRYQKLLEALELSHLDQERIIEEQQGNLSGGEKQKILLARALYKPSRILILDEPLSALDQAVSHRLLHEVLLRDPRLILMTVHHLPEDELAAFDGLVKLERLEG